MTDLDKYNYKLTLNLKHNNDFNYDDKYVEHDTLYVQDLGAAFNIQNDRLTEIRNTIKMVQGLDFMERYVKAMVVETNRALQMWTHSGKLRKYDMFDHFMQAGEYSIKVSIKKLDENILRDSFIES